FEGVDLLVAPFPDLLLYQPMDARDQHVFVMGAVPNPDHPVRWRRLVDSPKEIVVQFDMARGLERCDPNAGRIKAAAYVITQPIFPGDTKTWKNSKNAASAL